MAVIQSDPTVGGGGGPAPGGIARRRRPWWLAGAAGAAVLIGLGVAGHAYQPLGLWDLIGGFPGLHRAAGARTVNDFGAQAGEFYIPHQHRTFAIPVSLYNTGSFAVTIEAVALYPPRAGSPKSLLASGPARYWTEGMTTGLRPEPGRPIAGLSLAPGNDHGIYIAVPVRTPRCYISGAFAVLSSFYVKERFGIFTKWVQIPLMQPLLVNAPGPPVSPPGPDTVCPAR